MAFNRLQPNVQVASQSPNDAAQGYGEIYIIESAVNIGLSTSWIQITNFNANGLSDAAVTPDHTNDHLTAITAAVYDIEFGGSFSGGNNNLVELEILTNNGTTGTGNIHMDRTMDGSGTIGIGYMSGLLSLSSGDTVEVWARSTSAGSPNLTMKHGNLHIEMLEQN